MVKATTLENFWNPLFFKAKARTADDSAGLNYAILPDAAVFLNHSSRFNASPTAHDWTFRFNL